MASNYLERKNNGTRFVPIFECVCYRLCELVVKSEADVLTLIEQGGAVRKVASTNMNERSSRSHSCFTIKVEKKTTEELNDGVTRETNLNAKLNLVDLAGSERSKKTGATGSTLKEGTSINKWVKGLPAIPSCIGVME